MGVKHTNTDVKFSKTIRLGKNIDLDNAVAGEVEVGSLRDNGTNIQRWNGTFWENIGAPFVVTEITFADSPYSILTSDEILAVDATNGETILVLPTLKEGDRYKIKKKDSSANKVKYQGNGSNIDGLSEREISTQYNADEIIGESSEWGRY
ncbi:MAG: hypothetical protein V3V81_07360 [Candidatus Bathyarchaeia archaeon]